jgi:hypothetical protein
MHGCCLLDLIKVVACDAIARMNEARATRIRSLSAAGAFSMNTSERREAMENGQSEQAEKCHENAQ